MIAGFRDLVFVKHVTSDGWLVEVRHKGELVISETHLASAEVAGVIDSAIKTFHPDAERCNLTWDGDDKIMSES